MRLQDDLDFTTLNWVKQELDETLKQARQALEAYVEDPQDSSLMRFCATYLHQVQGTLRMVELYGAAMVVEEMERVANALLDTQIRQREEAYSVLMRGIVQLPDYLERLQSGHKDIPIVLLPLLNDLRACRGEKLLSESVLFSPDLGAALPRSAAGPDRPVPELELKAQVARLRANFQTGLLHWFRGTQNAGSTTALIGTLDRLRALTANDEARRLWWIAAGVLESVQGGAVDASAALKVLFGRVDREIKRLADSGEGSFRVDPPRELTKSLLYYIAHAPQTGERGQEIKHTYKLEQLLPTQQELEHAKGSLAGKNRALLDTVSAAIKEDLMRVKDALDLYLRTADAKPADLSAQTEVLDRVADTLGMLGLGVPRRVVQEQRAALTDIASGARKADEGALLDIAGALLYVEASLDDNIESLGAGAETETAPGASTELELPQAEVKKILDALMKEASTNLAQAKQDMVAFVESPWDHAKVTQIPRLLEEIGGALRMLHLDEPSHLLNALIRFVEVELIRLKRVPTPEQMDRLADSLASIEYYLEAARDQRGGRERILDVTRRSLESLGYWPIPEGEPPAPELDEIAGVALEQAPAPSISPAPPKPTAPEVDVHTISFATPTVSGAEGLRTELDDAAPHGDLPSIDLPSESIDDFIARMDRGETAPAVVETAPAPAPTTAELSVAVDIHPGRDMADLVVGESARAAVAPPPPAQDVGGLRFAETVPTQSLSAADDDDADQEPEFDWVEIEEEVEEEVEVEAPAAAAPAETSFQAVPSDDIDDEIREVFVEEVQDEIDNLHRQLPNWKSDVNDLERLKPVRRSFHTLKGSGRLVGAMALGEFSWKVENMLNRVLDKTIPASPAVLALLDHAVAALPSMLSALRGEGAPAADIAGIMGVAEKIAGGEEAWLTPTQAARTTTKVKVKVMRKRMVQVPRPRPVKPPRVEKPVELTRTLDVTRALEPAVELPRAHEAAPVSIPGAMAHASAGGTVMPTLDPMLLDILRSEVEGHLSVLRDYLAQCERSGPQPIGENVLRAVHTMHGAVSMADVPVINDLVGPLEGFVKRVRASNLAPTREGMAALADATSIFTQVVSLLDQPGAPLPDPGNLAARLEALRASLPEPESAFSVFDMALEEDAKSEPAPAVLADVPHDVELTETSLTGDDQALLDELRPADALVGAEFLHEEPAGALAQPGTMSIEPESVELFDIDAAAFDADAMADLATTPAAAPTIENIELIETPATIDDTTSLEDFVFESAELAGESITLEAAETPIALTDEHGLDLITAVPDALAGELADVESISLVEETTAWSAPTTESITLEDQAAFDSTESAFGAAAPAPAPMPQAAVVAPKPVAAANESGDIPAIADDVDPEGVLHLPDLDEDLLEIFVEEGNDILDKTDALVAQLRERPTEHEAIIGLQRHLHTLKGNARAVGLAGIGDLCHSMESLLEAVVGEHAVLSRAGVDALERAFDRLHHMVGRVARRQAVGMPLNTMARFEELVANNGQLAQTTPVVAPAPAAPIMVEPTPVVAPPPSVAEPPARAPTPARAPVETLEDEPIARAPQEMIRVRSDLLDALVNFAGEVSIYRSRLEQQIGTFRFNLVELDQTTARLREQLRKLEIETEAQIIARYQREAQAGGGETTFDPLELDRFSTLQQLSRALAESVSDLQSLQNVLDDLTRQAETLLLQQSRVSSELQEGLMRTRMVPFDSIVPFLRRLIRQTADELGKRASLRIEGAQGEMDRNLLERMKAPFEHMLRNALAHGIETPETRRSAGKPEEGTVRIAVSREATEVVIRVIDDGRGMDRDAIRRKAIERGLMRPDAQLSDRDLFGFILETGFSTAETVTKIAGRGVGMDVVASEIKQLGGSLAIDSTRGKGSEFIVRLPFTLAVTQAILVRLGDQTFAVPMSSVQGVARITRDELDKRLAMAHPAFNYAGEEYVIHELNTLLGLPSHRATDEAQLPLLLARTGDQRAAIRVDAVLGSREIVVKSVGPQVSSVPGIFGATIMGDGSVVVILDLAPVVRRSAALREESAIESALDEATPGVAQPVTPAIEKRRQPLVMVVDDSITMRKVTGRVLERHDMEVVTAKDGLDAVEKLQDRVPDLVLLDIEMPRMDGYELATYMRNDPRLRTVPIIMITSRTGEKHRQRAFEIGVDRYLGKPYQEADLLRNVEETLRLSRAAH